MANVEANVSVNVQTNANQASKQLNDIAAALERISKEGSAFDRPNEFAEALERLSKNGSAFKDVGEDIEGTSEAFEELGNSVLQFNINGEDITNLIGKLGSVSGVSSKEVGKLASVLGIAGPEVAVLAAGVGASIAVLKTYADLCKKCATEVTDLVKAFGDGAVTSIDWFIDGLNTLVEVTEDTIDKLQEFAKVGAEIQDTYFSLYNIMGNEGGDKISNFADGLERLYGLDATGVVADMQNLFSMTAKLSSNVDKVSKATESFYMMAQSMSKVYGQEISTVINSIKTAVNTGSIRAGSALYNILDSSEIAEFKQLNNEAERANFLLSKSIGLQGVFQQYLDTDAGKLYTLNQQWNSLLGNIGQLALGIYAKIAPLLTNLLKIANAVVTSLMKILNINVTTGTTAGTDLKGYLSDLTDGFEESSKAAKEAKKQVASFDDVIQINDSGNSVADGLKGLSGMDFDDGWLNELADDADKAKSKLDELIDSLKELLEEGKYYEAGQLLAKALKEWLQGIDWDSIRENAREAGKSIAEFLNGFLADSELFYEIGNALAQGVNTIAEFLNGFAKEFDFKQLGVDIMTAWNGFWQNLDADLLGETAYEWFMGLFETIKGMVETGDTSAGSKLGQIINAFFGNFTEDDLKTVSDSIIGAINWLVSNIDAFLTTVSEGDGAEKIQKFVSDLMEKFGDNAEYWGQVFGKLIKSVLSFLYETISNADKSGLTDGIAEFLAGVDLDEIFDLWFKLKMELIWIVIETAIKTLFLDIKNKITGETETDMQDTFELVFTIISGLLGNLAVKIGWFIGEKIAENFESMHENFSKGMETVKTNITTWFDNIKKSIQNKFDEIKSALGEKINSIIAKIGEWVNRIKEAFTAPFRNFNPFSGISFKLPSIGGFNISNLWSGQHATGGITNGASIGMIGEAGREAILPLDRNTGWMDELASKINNSGGNVNSAPVVIDMSKAVKPVYTRSEYLAMADVFAEALKARGVVVSMEY